MNYLNFHQVESSQILNDYGLQWTVTTPLYNIGEQTYQLSKELKDSHPEVPWSKVAGLRHRLVHDYDGTNWDIIVLIIYKSLPEYIGQLEKIVVSL